MQSNYTKYLDFISKATKNKNADTSIAPIKSSEKNFTKNFVTIAKINNTLI